MPCSQVTLRYHVIINGWHHHAVDTGVHGPVDRNHWKQRQTNGINGTAFGLKHQAGLRLRYSNAGSVLCLFLYFLFSIIFWEMNTNSVILVLHELWVYWTYRYSIVLFICWGFSQGHLEPKRLCAKRETRKNTENDMRSTKTNKWF